MGTRDDVPHDRRLSGAITVTVDEVRSKPKARRDVELAVTDENGAELRVVIWETHGIDRSWEEGATYELSGVRGKRYSTRHGTRVELHSTKAFRVQTASPNDEARVLVLGDTHVGYRHRPRSDKPRWARSVDARDVFVRCLERARDLDVDAVVHTGDVFDHGNTQGDRNAVARAITRTVEADIPFYYIFGNHDDEQGRKLLTSTPGTQLTPSPSQISGTAVNLLGVDHSGRAFPAKAPDPSKNMRRGRNVLVVHESPHPVVDDGGSLLYQNDGNKADLSGFIETARFRIDLVVTGHLHVAERARVRGYDIPVLVTGATIPISTYEKDSDPSTWLMTATESRTDLQRRPL